MNLTAQPVRESEGPLWTVYVTGPGIHEVTQAEHLAEVGPMTRSIVSLLQGIPQATLSVTILTADAS